MITSLTDRITLNNGTQIPGLGLGVFKIDNTTTATTVASAIQQGYRLIDTAQIYGNETGTGAGIQQGLAATGLQRADLFITSKGWNAHLTYDETITAFNDSLSSLGLDYLDLYLIHWPGHDAYRDAWRALEDLYRAGKIKALGVSNFEPHHLKDLLTFAKVMPVIDQVERHPKLNQAALRTFTAHHDIKLQAWSPLMQGQILDNPVLQEIAVSHHKTVAQVILRWDIQQHILLVVKSVKPKRLASNAAVFDFKLSPEDMQRIDALNVDLRVGPNPDEFDF
ncbi:aldo/keto reductase [Levilactobacillus brevis]|uniref:aldo/keto reductase n=1 Tax=Levilactobacillus brevis TaxID=1580 RepID=UPI001BA64530|nr:aldo/keto reductase [Levilactobacillus brevis]MBS1005758.1 aldo/keto reductase [Levilactobacillus brevis]MBS1012918.1 aldo/keto reductase [Levilactobacillus brevis]